MPTAQTKQKPQSWRYGSPPASPRRPTLVSVSIATSHALERTARQSAARIQRGATVSEFDDLKGPRLDNWGAWGRQDSDRPDPEACGFSACADYSPSKDWDPAWGDPDEVPMAPPMPIDHRDADLLDGYIRQLRTYSVAYYEAIRENYYKRHPQKWEALDPAIRSLLDLIQANRATVKKMRSLGA